MHSCCYAFASIFYKKSLLCIGKCEKTIYLKLILYSSHLKVMVFILNLFVQFV